MNIDRIVFAIAGVLILISTIFAVSHSIYWLCLTALVGVNITQAAFTGFCPIAIILKAVGVKSGEAF